MLLVGDIGNTETKICLINSKKKIVRKIIGSNLQIFSPGIRMANESSNDQKRVCTPLESIRNGSDKIIMGRSLIDGNLEENIKKVVTSISN